MPYSSAPKYDTRDEVGGSDNGPRDTHLSAHAGQDYSFHGMRSVPRSSGLVETEIRRQFQTLFLQNPSTATSPMENYTFNTSGCRLEETNRDRILCGLEVLSLADNDNATDQCPAIGQSQAKLEKRQASLERDSNMECDNRGNFENTVAAQKVEQTPTLNSPPCSSTVDLHSGEKTPGNGYSIGIDKIEKDTVPVPLKQDKTGKDEEDSSKVDVITIGEDLTEEYCVLISRLLRDIVYKNSFFREIGSWTPPEALPGQLGEGIQSDENAYASSITVVLDVDADQWKDEIVDGKIAQCAGNGKVSGRTNQGSQRHSQPTRRGSRVEKAAGRPRGKGRQATINNDNEEDGEEEDEEEEEEEDREAGTYSTVSPIINDFACPFFKRYSEEFGAGFSDDYSYTFRTCATTKLRDIPRVKEHLRRVHTQPLACPRCQQVFKEVELLNEHVLKSMEDVPCPQRPKTMEFMFVKPSVAKQLKRKSQGPDQIAKWNAIYSLLFPGEAVQSPTHNGIPQMSPGLRHGQSFISMLSQDMPTLLCSDLEPKLCQFVFGEDQRKFLRIIVSSVASCQSKVWDSYEAQQASYFGQTSRSDERRGSNSNLLGPPDVHDRFANDALTPAAYRHQPRPIYSAESHPLSPRNPQMISAPATSMVGISMLPGAPNMYNTNVQLPPTPNTMGIPSPLGTTSQYIHGRNSSESWNSDSGYGSVLHCGKPSCDESSCEECLKLMRSPASQLQNHLMAPLIPDTFDEVGFGPLFYDNSSSLFTDYELHPSMANSTQSQDASFPFEDRRV